MLVPVLIVLAVVFFVLALAHVVAWVLGLAVAVGCVLVALLLSGALGGYTRRP